MTNNRNGSAKKNPIMLRLEEIYGTPALLPGEDRQAYFALRELFTSRINPRDGLEAMWTQELVDLTWEGWRRRKLKPALIRAAIPDAVMELFKSANKLYDDAQKAAIRYVKGSAEDKEGIEQELQRMGYSAAELTATAYRLRADDLSLLERFDTGMDVRRIAILREIDRHRDWAADQEGGPANLPLLPRARDEGGEK